VSFEPRQQMIIDFDPKTGKLLIRCPFWANDMLNNLPSKRWSKSQRAWSVVVIKQNMDAIRELTRMGGVNTTSAARAAMDEYDERIAGMGKRGGVEFPPWYKFKTEPRKHQRRALDKGYGLKAFGLFMDMQTGKSKTVIDLVVAHRMQGETFGLLILVKRTLRRNWIIQLETHCPIPFSAHLPDTNKKRDFEKWLSKPHDFKVMIVGWESLSAGAMHEICKQFMRVTQRPSIAGDETSYITNHKAIRSERAVELATMAEYKYALTGTPAVEGPLNLFMQFEFLDRNIIGIGDFYAFRNRYAIMGGYQREIRPGLKMATEVVGYQNLDELMNMIAPYTFQVLKKDAYDLPPKRYERREVQISEKQRKMYDLIKKEGVLRIKGNDDMVLKNILSVALRLHQVTGGYAVKGHEKKWMGKDGNPRVKMEYEPVELIRPEENTKMAELIEAVNDFKGRKQGLVWVVYTPEIMAICKLLRGMGLRIGELHGGVPDSDRQPMVSAYERGDLDIIVGNASTGGMGYTMMASEVNIFYNNTFKAIDRIQAEDRAYGDGQLKSGVWIDIVAEKTIDNTIMQALTMKMDLSDYVRHRIGEITKLLDGE